jgi:outer membrane protein assembly factor BamD (BamD/ComL family)
MRSLLLAGSFAALLMMASCGNGEKTEDGKMTKEKMEANIDTMEAKLHAKPEMDLSTASATVALYADYANNFPDDPKTADYLFKAGEISSSMRQGKQAIGFFNTVYTKYPKYEKAPYSLFLQGFIYESQLNDTTKAKEIYKQVIEKYPNERIAEDAKASIDNMGKSPEELIREFEKKNQEGEKKPAS